jgi:glycosyltransferase involved in cell wall biosynthesis
MVKVSVIVPVYNVEEYLPKCLDGLVHQTLKEIEIIVVNDGATDNSQKIIDEYVNKHSCIKAYIKPNGGLSDARNYGLQFVTGEYIGFVDSDDFVEVDMYELMYKKAKEEDSDIVECNLRHTYADREDIEVGKKIIDKKEMLMFGRSVVWNKIYRRKWLQKTNVKFPKGLIYEDVEFFLKLIPHINTYSYIDEACIHYVQRSSSLNNFSSLKTQDIFIILNNIYEYYERYGYLEEYGEALEFFYARILLCSSFSRMCRIADKYQCKMALKNNWDTLMNEFPKWRNNPYLKKKSSVKLLFMRTVTKTTYKLYSLLFPTVFKMKIKLKNGWS